MTTTGPSETDAERQLRHAQMIVKANQTPEPPPTPVALPVVCTDEARNGRPSHYYRRDSDRIWVCINCKEPRP